MAKIPGLPIAFIGLGGVLVWSGIENEPVTAVFRLLAQGKTLGGPNKVGEGPPETFATPGTASTGTATGPEGIPGGRASLGTGTGAAIAADAMTYVGKFPYVWDGSPANGGGDCSSFANWVIGHDEGLAIPGWGAGKYTGTTHGPDVAMWVLWGGAFSISRSQVQAGDLILWPPNEHMGIATSNTEFVSALNPSLGTLDITMASNGPGWIARRLKAVQ